MKALRLNARSIIAVAVLLGILCVAGASMAGDKILPPNANAYSKSLARWLYGYWAYYLGNGGFTEAYQPGPAPIVYMPMPYEGT